jgi:hypothetical protein
MTQKAGQPTSPRNRLKPVCSHMGVPGVIQTILMRFDSIGNVSRLNRPIPINL